jgi:uncharacterized coiled-coil protein SlyX
MSLKHRLNTLEEKVEQLEHSFEIVSRIAVDNLTTIRKQVETIDALPLKLKDLTVRLDELEKYIFLMIKPSER